MAFPTTPILDDFDRPAEGPPLSASWSNPSGATGLRVVDATCRTPVETNETADAVWLAGPLAECEVYVTTLDSGAETADVYLFARAQDAQDPRAICYALHAYRAAGNPSYVELAYSFDGTWIDNWGRVALDWLPGDAFGLTVETAGTSVVLTAYHRPVAGDWTEVSAVTDASTQGPAAGYIGLGLSGNDATPESYNALADFGGGEMPQPPVPPAAPTALTAQAVLSTRVDLAWTGVSEVDGYRVERGLDGLTFVEIATVAAGVTHLADTDISGHAVAPQTVYYYRVRAYKGALYSAYSNVVSVITPLDGFMIDAISAALIDALIANTSLKDVKLFIDGGTPQPVPQDKHPFVEVIIGEETPVDELTGGVSERSYRGLLTFTAQLTQTARADWLDPVEGDARRARVGSYSLIKRLVMIAQVELQREVHQDLGELVTTIAVDALTVREVVTAFRLDGSIVYGLDERTNNYENFGSMGFVVETERTIT